MMNTSEVGDQNRRRKRDTMLILGRTKSVSRAGAFIAWMLGLGNGTEAGPCAAGCGLPGWAVSFWTLRFGDNGTLVV